MANSAANFRIKMLNITFEKATFAKSDVVRCMMLS